MLLHRGSAELDCFDDPPRSPLTNVTPGAFDRDVGAGSHGDADVGLGECRGVVDAVSGHRDNGAGRLKLFDAIVFLFRADTGLDFVRWTAVGRRLGRYARCPRSTSRL